MFIKKWDDLPSFMQTDLVREYYDVLCKKQGSLFFKRLFDIILSIFLIILFSPILLAVSLVVKLDSKGPIFFKQQRLTQYGRVFQIYKFRTMVQRPEGDEMEVTLAGDSRITKSGKILRKFRIDEIPQLFNILWGDMSFVGPRPEVERYVQGDDEEMIATLLVQAGVTSMASIAFRNEDQILKNSMNPEWTYLTVILPSKIKMNLQYIKDLSVLYDIKVMFITFMTVFLRP